MVLFLAFAILFLEFACDGTEAGKDPRPNIVLIFIDDMGYADVSAFGATDYQTPNIDRLGREGMRFTSFYASQAVCSASRASLLTGCYAERVGIQGALTPGSPIGLNPDETTIADMLKAAGYATAIFGKWHLGRQPEFLPLQQGFDEYLGLPYSNDMWPVGFDGVPVPETDQKKSQYPPLPLIEGNTVIDTIATLEDQGRLTQLYTEKALEFIRKNKDHPFFLYLPHSMVHVPLGVSDAFKGKSGQGLFADVVMELDWSVGEIIRVLKEQGLYENTLVIFTSDNGPWLNFGNHAGSAYPLREGKGCMWEGGPRVPAFMQWPGKIPAGTECSRIASTIDIFPTLAEITKARLPEKKIDGVSILPLLQGQKDRIPRESFLYYYGGDLIAVRKANWKLVFPHTYRSYEGVEPGRDGFPGPYSQGKVTEPELYDLDKDIGETTDLAAEHPDIVKDLAAIGQSAREELGDRIQNIKGSQVRKPGRIQQEKTHIAHKAIGKNIRVNSEYAWQYSGTGDSTLTNGILGSLDFSDGEWLGFHGNDFEAVVDLGKEMEIRTVECGFLIHQGAWIFAPEQVAISLSADGNAFRPLQTFQENARDQHSVPEVKRFKTNGGSHPTRFIKVQARSIKTCPAWHPGAGEKAWIFVDEVVVE